MSYKEDISLLSNTHYCFSSANRHSHYNNQKIRFEKNLLELENKKELKLSQHVKMIAEMFTSLAQSQGGKSRAMKRKYSISG